MTAVNEQQLKQQVENILDVEKKFSAYEQQLMQDEQFKEFLRKQKEVKKQISDTWKVVEQAMLEHGIKSVKGDWGSITIAERLNWSTPEDAACKLAIKLFEQGVLTKSEAKS